MIVYRGRYADRGLHVRILETKDPDPAHAKFLLCGRAANILHFQPGMATGYSGAGPRVLALAILLDVMGNELAAFALHRAFASAFLYQIPSGQPWEIGRDDVVAWIAKQAARAVEAATVAALAVEGGMR